jgi:hypothetical protein
MRTTTKILLAAIIAAACTACGAGTSPSHGQSMAPASFASKCKPDNADSFAQAVQYTATEPYTSGTFNDPVPLGALNPNGKIYADIKNAFAAAPQKFRRDLCKLDGVFVDQRPCSSNCTMANAWGFRNPVSKKRYIGLPLGLWTNDSTSAPKFSVYETGLLTQVILALEQQYGYPSKVWPSAPPVFRTATSRGSSPPVDIDTSTTTVLAALAHEFGHILWYDQLKGSGVSYDPSSFCIDSTAQGFFDVAWQRVSTPPQWLPFSVGADVHTGVKTDELLKAIAGNNADAAATLLNALFSDDAGANASSGVWSSFFATVSPSEDFAETFKFYIVSHPRVNGSNPITSMPLAISGASGVSYTPDVFADFALGNKKKELKRKWGCLD